MVFIGQGMMNIGSKGTFRLSLELQLDGAQAVASLHTASELHGTDIEYSVYLCERMISF